MCGSIAPMENLTPKQQKVLEFIQSKIHEHIPPTIREIARALGFSSTGTVRDYLALLEKKGYLKRLRNKSRAIELPHKSFDRIPIIATIAAGKPNLAYEDIQGYVDPNDLYLGRLSQNDIFALKVTGDSMIEAGIMEGDIAIIKKQTTADSNDIIAALVEDNEATLKRLKKKDDRLFLEAANKNYPPIYKEFTVIGKLIRILRKY
jgi:repressor LexA